MSLVKFDNEELIRSRVKALNLVEADVMISKGNLSGEEYSTLLEFEAMLEKFENIGINSKDSPVFNDEDIIEEVDYETEVVGIKALGDIITKRMTQGLMTWISDDLRNAEVTLLIIPKDHVANDRCLFIQGVKLSKKSEGKGNSEATPQITFSYARRADKWTDVYEIYAIPAV